MNEPSSQSSNAHKANASHAWAEDYALAQQALAGDAMAWTSLVDGALEGTYGMLLRLVNQDHELAAEFCQDAMARAWERLSSWRGDCRFATWLYRLARNRALDRLKAASNRNVALSEDLSLAPASTSVEREVQQAEHIAAVREAIARLSPTDRELILLRDFEHQSYQEIAETLNVPEGTAKSRVFRARQQLRNLLSPMMEAEAP